VSAGALYGIVLCLLFQQVAPSLLTLHHGSVQQASIDQLSLYYAIWQSFVHPSVHTMIVNDVQYAQQLRHSCRAELQYDHTLISRCYLQLGFMRMICSELM